MFCDITSISISPYTYTYKSCISKIQNLYFVFVTMCLILWLRNYAMDDFHDPSSKPHQLALKLHSEARPGVWKQTQCTPNNYQDCKGNKVFFQFSWWNTHFGDIIWNPCFGMFDVNIFTHLSFPRKRPSGSNCQALQLSLHQTHHCTTDFDASKSCSVVSATWRLRFFFVKM